MYTKLLFVLFTLFCAETSGQLYKSTESMWIVLPEGSLMVAGSTNVSKFNCSVSNFLDRDTLTLEKQHTDEPIRMSGSINLDIKRFDCGNTLMTKDLWKALKAKDYPKMKIRFISLDEYPESNQKLHNVGGIVSISLAGITKRFAVHYTVTRKAPDLMVLQGKRKLNFSDFNIIPPRKLGGMVQASNSLIVEFNLGLTKL